MRRILTSAVMAGALLIGGTAGEAGAAPVTTSAQNASTVTQQAPAQGHVRSGSVTASGAHEQTLEQASVERRKPRPRTQRRGFFSRLFGTLMFLFIGLPLLIVLGIVLMVMMRRNRRRQETQIQDERAYGERPMTGGQDVYRDGPNDRI